MFTSTSRYYHKLLSLLICYIQSLALKIIAYTIVCLALPVLAFGKPIEEPSVKLEILQTSGVRSVSSTKAHHDFGSVSLAKQTIVEQDFVLNNSGDVSVTVTELRTACTCMSAMLVPGKDAKTPTEVGSVIPSGESRTVHVLLMIDRVLPGSVTKTVRLSYMPTPLFSRDPSQPTIQSYSLLLELRGVIQPVIAFGTQRLDFGEVKAGHESHVIITGTLDPVIGATGKTLPALVSNTPILQVESVTGTYVTGSKRPTTPLIVRWKVKLAKDAPIGSFVSSLRFRSDDPIWKNSSLVVTGKVTGDIEASPSLVAFGLIGDISKSEKPLVRQVRLFAQDAAAFAGIKFAVESAFVTAELAPVAADDLPRIGIERSLLITLDASKLSTIGTAPFQTKVTILLANGQQLVLPVTAFLQRAMPQKPFEGK